jgi:F-type H+-transporting ATPase subunit b
MAHPTPGEHAETAPHNVAGEHTVATTQADGAVHHDDHGPTLLGLSAEGWVYVGLTIFILIAIFVAKAPKKIAEALDARIAEAKRQLDEARAIRAEAEALLAEAKARNAASAGDAAAILAHAEQEAEALIAQAEIDAKELAARRTRMAKDKIAAAERAAIAEIRARAADAAARAATALIAERHDASADKALVDKTISGLGRVN